MSTTVNKHPNINSKREMCITALHKAKSQTEGYLSKNKYERMNILPSSSTIIKTLGGTWSRAKKEAELPTKPGRGQYDEKDCINAIKKATDILGYTPSIRDYEELGLSPSRNVIKKLFGKWNIAVKAAGFKPNTSRSNNQGKQYTRKDCIESLKKAAKIIGSSPTREQYDLLGLYPSYDTIQKNFESFNNAKKEANLECYNTGNKEYSSKNNNYGPNWSKIRESVFEEHDGCKCCGINRRENFDLYGKDMAIHHIIPFKNFESKKIANHKSNLVPLCHHCHAQLEPKNVENQCNELDISKPDVISYQDESNAKILTKI